MKKHLLLITALGSAFISMAQNVNIPDANFKAALVANATINTNMDTEIQVTEANTFTGYLNVENLAINDLTGLEEFTQIYGLNCSQNNLTGALDLTANTLLDLVICHHNNLTSIDVNGLSLLETIQAYNNGLTSINFGTNCPIYDININFNPTLASLDLSECASLTEFYGHGCSFTSLDFSTNTSLHIVVCSLNNLTTLDFSNNTALGEIYCEENQLTSLNLGTITNLYELDCDMNQLTSLDLSYSTSLTLLSAYSNNLTTLDLSNNTALQLMFVYDNQITDITLGASMPDLQTSNVESNQLISYDVSMCPILTRVIAMNNNLEYLNVANGNNTNFLFFAAYNNPNLTCIQVDDPTWATNNWTVSGNQIDSVANFNTFCSGVGLEEETMNSINVYPNPANDYITIDSDETIRTIQIIDINGKQVISSTSDFVSVTSLPEGMYIVEITSETSVSRTRFIKE